MDNKIFNLASHWEEIGANVQKICLRDRLQRPYGNDQTLKSHQKAQTSGGEGNQDNRESSHYPSYRRTADRNREYSDSFRLTRGRPKQLSSSFTPLGNQQISGQKSPFFAIPGSFQEKKRIQWQKKDLFQPKQRESDRMIQKLL
ncbi:hypothetical protein O181_056526 [Austropuccinia psidii MF-1]|uniref:Uncharacterized protein n=1 Tax=Austropuccinia psidii MF-1 TaxID=1389203 RepID=A0A9Q3E6H8_9BASI|nr:hypothetical protein [Austropuccinia psidii MF-1]